MDMYKILLNLDSVEKKTLNESIVNEVSDAEQDAHDLAKHKSRLKRERTRLGLSMPKPDGGPRKSDVPAAARKARGEDPLTLQDLDEAELSPVQKDIELLKNKIKGDRSRGSLSENSEKEIDYNTLEIDGIDYRDAPEFSDAYFSDGYYTDGTQLSDADLARLTDDGDLLYQMLTDKLYEGDVEEGNEFSGALAKAKANGADHFEVDGKTYPVKEGDQANKFDDPANKRKKKSMSYDPETGKRVAEQNLDQVSESIMQSIQQLDESYADFFDKKMAYQRIGADVDGQAHDYTVTFKDGTRKRYVEKDGRRRVMTLSPVDRQDDVDDEGNVVKRGRGRPKGAKRSLGAKGPTGRSKLMNKEDINEASDYMNDLVKFAKVVRSVKTPEQMKVAQRMGDLLLKKYQGMPVNKLEKFSNALGYGTLGSDLDRMHDVDDEVYNKKKEMELPENVNPAEHGEFNREGDMAKNQLYTIKDAAKELCNVLGDDENLPEWVQSKIVKAADYIDTARDYMSARKGRDDEEIDVDLVAEKAVSKSQQQAAGASLAAKRGETPKSELKGASKEMAKMSKSDLEDFAKTKHKGLPDKKKEESVEEESKPDYLDLDGDGDKKESMKKAAADKEDKKDNKDDVEETTTAGSVATGGESKGKSGGMYGKGIYENYNAKFDSILNESLSVNMSTSDHGDDTVSVTGTGEDAQALTDLLQMAGLFQSGGYQSACPSTGTVYDSEEAIEEDYANEPDELYGDMDMMLNKLSGGLNGPKKQVNPNNDGDNPLAMQDLGKKNAPTLNLEQVSEQVEQEAKDRLWNLYKRYE